MESEQERELLDSGTPSEEQFQYAMDSAIKAGFVVTEVGGAMSWVKTVTINSSPERTLATCMRDNDYWVRSSEEKIWPPGDGFGFLLEQPFRNALQAFILGPLVYDQPSDPIGQWCNQPLGLGSLFSSCDLDDSPEA